MSNDIEKIAEAVVVTAIVAPVSIAVGAVKGIGAAFGWLIRDL